MAAGGELVEVVDGFGRVLDVVPRATMREHGLTHRSTYIAVVRHRLDPPTIDRLAALFPADGAPIPADEAAGLLRANGVDGSSRLVVHQRAPWKDVNPSWWDLAFGGVCGVGESWLDSARRELAEEAGLSARLLDLGPGRYTDDTTDIVARCFLAIVDEEPHCADGEVVAVDTVGIDRIQTWMQDHAVCPDTVALLAPLLGALAR